MSLHQKVRLQKVIARSGIASRREAERLIANGLVAVNGRVVTELGVQVAPSDSISVSGRRIVATEKRYLIINKPRGYVCSKVGDKKFPSFLELLPDELRSVHHIGRLDVGSEGLLLATTDGELTQIVTHPSFEVPKEYSVWVRGLLSDAVRKRCLEGVVVDGEILRFRRLLVSDRVGLNARLGVTLIGGKNREIRRLLEACDLQVRRLQRVAIGAIELGNLKVGKWRELVASEIASLKRFGKSEG